MTEPPRKPPFRFEVWCHFMVVAITGWAAWYFRDFGFSAFGIIVGAYCGGMFGSLISRRLRWQIMTAILGALVGAVAGLMADVIRTDM